ncbi:metallophosphoesterase family protein [Oribacterium sp. WCC10]|uniref:metallophosphoesterase family protein n=1 Tax=Oribacterium sp. WCC10 TaxID=1855343 RepID=UPI0008F01537|nr:DNA repair exonuclease [Oribacterium sp. WCC10]SFG14808.1 DNA repair exonuclease SbcCD nuclease subunit [Oribacterium sp. WCC10]
MRFIHTADINWGMVPDSNQPWGKDRANDIKTTFRKIIEKCRDFSVDCLFISGNLFHRQPMNKDLQELNYLFSSIPSTHIVIISGANDRISPNSALLSFNWSANVTWILSDKPEEIYFDDINTKIYGFSYHSRELRETVIDTIQPENDGHIHILLAHGGDNDHMPVDVETLSKLPFDYVALGYLHKPVEIVERRVIYSGSPEPLDMTETGPHGFYFGDINPITHKVQRLTFMDAARVSYIPLEFSVTDKTSNEVLVTHVEKEIKAKGEHNIYMIRITGKHNPDVHFSLSPLMNKYRIVSIHDDSEPQYDFAAIYKEHPSDIIGFYIRKLLRDDPDDMSYVEKKALYYGINALLKSQKGGN